MGPKKKEPSTPTDAKRRTTNRKWNPGIFLFLHVIYLGYYTKENYALEVI